MDRQRRRRRPYHALLFLIAFIAFGNIAHSQGALMRFFRAGYYLTKSVDTLQTIKYDLNKTTTKAWLDSVMAVRDTITFNLVTQTGLDQGDSASYNFVNTAGWYSKYGYRNLAVAMAMHDLKVVRVGITHAQTIGTVYLQADTLVMNDTNSVTVPKGALIFVSWVGATTYTSRAGQHPRATEKAQQVRIYYDPSPGYNSGGGAFVPCFQAVQVPLIIGFAVAQTGLQDDAEIAVTVSVVRQ